MLHLTIVIIYRAIGIYSPVEWTFLCLSSCAVPTVARQYVGCTFSSLGEQGCEKGLDNLRNTAQRFRKKPSEANIWSNNIGIMFVHILALPKV